MNLILTANILGILALLAAAIAISPSLINLLRLSLIRQRSILQIAHAGLMFAICLGLAHGLLITQQENINFYDLNTYWSYAVGLFAFNILALIAFMYSELKLDLKKLYYLSCSALLLLVCHIGQQFIF